MLLLINAHGHSATVVLGRFWLPPPPSSSTHAFPTTFLPLHAFSTISDPHVFENAWPSQPEPRQSKCFRSSLTHAFLSTTKALSFDCDCDCPFFFSPQTWSRFQPLVNRIWSSGRSPIGLPIYNLFVIFESNLSNFFSTTCQLVFWWGYCMWVVFFPFFFFFG